MSPTYDQPTVSEWDDAQIDLFDFVTRSSETLASAVNRLLATAQLPASDWHAVVDQFVRRSRPRDLSTLVPSSEISVERILDTNDCPRPWLFGPAILRAHWMAALHDDFPELRPYPHEPLITAALLADCGLAALAGRDSKSRRVPAAGSVEFKRHPEVSAALVSMIENASPLAAVLAGAHHERLDGSGFPRRLRDRELSPLMRHFTAVMRWSELLAQATSATSVNEAVSVAASALWRETSRGLFDAKAVTRLLAAVRSDLPAAAQRDAISRARLVLHSPPSADQTLSTPPAAIRIIDGPQPIPEPNLNGRHENAPARRAARPA